VHECIWRGGDASAAIERLNGMAARLKTTADLEYVP
jgi:hypothetical protein